VKVTEASIEVLVNLLSKLLVREVDSQVTFLEPLMDTAKYAHDLLHKV
jgi:hypothetical protein